MMNDARSMWRPVMFRDLDWLPRTVFCCICGRSDGSPRGKVAGILRLTGDDGPEDDGYRFMCERCAIEALRSLDAPRSAGEKGGVE